MNRKMLMYYEPVCLNSDEVRLLKNISYDSMPFIFFYGVVILLLMIIVIKRELNYEQFYYNRDNHNTKVTVHSMV
jgi:hypothetical protein